MQIYEKKMIVVSHTDKGSVGIFYFDTANFFPIFVSNLI